MPEKTEYKYGKHKDAVVSFLQSVADFVTDQRTNTLFSYNKAAEIALEQGVTPTEVEFSFPWWVQKAKDFQALGVNLPMVTTVKYLRRCEPVRYCEHGIGRLIGGVVKPIVFEEDAILVFHSTPELKNLMSYGRRLAAAVNETYYGPSEDRTRHLIAEYKTFCESLLAKGEDRIVSTTNGSPTAAAVAPVPRPLALQAEGGMTATQKADLFHEYLSKMGEVNEGIQNITESNKTIAANTKMHIQGLTTAVTNAIAVEASLAQSNSDNAAKLNGGMEVANLMAASFFGVAPETVGLPAPNGAVAALPGAAPLRAIVNGNNGVADPIMEGMRNVNIDDGIDGILQENVGMAVHAEAATTPERRPKPARPKSTRRKARPVKFADEFAPDGYGID